MSLEHKPLDEVTEKDLIELINNQISEKEVIDDKQQLNQSNLKYFHTYYLEILVSERTITENQRMVEYGEFIIN